jgi:hypothetical protein
MNSKLLGTFAMASAVLLTAPAGWAQPAYFTAITNLNPVGYWPMHEVEAAAPGDIETNYGSLGQLGTGYYPDWFANAPKGIVRGSAGALAGDTDPSVHFTHILTSGTGIQYTNQLIIPHNSSLSTLNPPFSVECWYEPTNQTTGVAIWGQTDFEGLNTGPAGGISNYDGIVMNWANGTFVPYGFDGMNGGMANANKLLGNGSPVEPSNQWYHLVLTCDASTNFALYVNGSIVSGPTANVGKYSADSWSPLTIGSGFGGTGGTRSIAGYMDEFAVYATNLPAANIAQHYSDGINPAPPTSYFYDVTNDNAVIYLRMDAPAYTAPVQPWPALTNYGSVGVNGVYTPGTMPGIQPGPATIGGIPYSGLLGTNVPQLSGVSSYADAGYASVFDPVGTGQTFTITALFRGNPSDNRIQDIAGHSDNSWRVLLTPTGLLQFAVGSGTPLSSMHVYNDGNWHQVVAVYDGVGNTQYLYVDGALESQSATGGISIPGSSSDVMIGTDPQYTNNPAGLGRQFAGQVCEVGFFTNALSAGQVQTLYDALGVGPSITTQPVSASVGAGTTFTNVVTVTGNPPLYYQWYTNGIAFGGQTNASLILNPVQAGYASSNYYLVVTNIAGSVTSSVVSLTVYTTPVIDTQLPITYSNLLGTNFLTLYAGANPALSISAVGAPPLYFQWFTNGVSMADATNASVTLPDVNIGVINSYCIVTNYLGSATSMVWSASVIADPTNSSNGLAPYPQTVLALNPIGYWRLNETDDGAFDGNPGALCLDYAGGNNGIYINVYLANNGAYADPGYNPVTDPSDTAALFGYYSPNNSDVSQIGTNIDFSTPAGNNGEFSVECWVNFAQTNVCGMVTKGYGNGGEEFSLDNDVPGVPKFFVRNAAGTGFGVTPAFIEAKNTWYHMVGVCDEANSNIVLYINGQPAAISNFPAIYNAGIFNDLSANMTIGARSASLGSGNNNQTMGSINDVAVFNYALSPGQVADQYDAGGGAIAPYLIPLPSANITNAATTTLTIPVTAVGTPPIGYQWTNLNTGATLASGVTNGSSLDATLVYSNVPASWNGDQLELIVTNNYGTTNVFVTLSITNMVTVNPNPTNIVFSATGGQLTLTWPADHTGWRLQAQTNGTSAPGITATNWYDISGSAATDQFVVPIGPTNGSVFYRLIYP